MDMSGDAENVGCKAGSDSAYGGSYARGQGRPVCKDLTIPVVIAAPCNLGNV